MRKACAILVALLIAFAATAQTSTCGTPLKGPNQQRFDEAVEAYRSKNYDKCATIISKLVKAAPRNADVHLYAGLIAAHRNNSAGIRTHFGKVFSICPTHPDARVYLFQGIIRYSDDDFGGAVSSLNRFFDIVNTDQRPEYMVYYNEASNYLHWSQFLDEASRNKAPFAPQVMLGASSRHDELMPYITFDGEEIYYIRYVPEDDAPTFYQRELEHKTPRLCISRWKDTTFSEGQVLPEPFNTHSSEGGITITADGRTLYIAALQSNRNNYANFDIFTSSLVNGHWTPLQPASNAINGERTWEGQPSITPDGQYIYFASNRPGGQGGTDIWRCRRLPNGDWSRAENLGSSVNTPGNEKCPFIHADGHTLFFASNGWQGFGGYDTYFINLNDPTNNIPTNLGLPINSEKDDICFGVMSNGRMAYYGGQHPVRGMGGHDIIQFELYAAARPEGMTPCKGVVTNAGGTPIAAQIHLNRTGSNDAHYILDTTGRYCVMLSTQQNNLVWATAEGCLPWATIATRQNATLPQRIALQPAKKNNRMPISTGSVNGKLTPDEQRLIDVYIDYLLQHPKLFVRIETPHAVQAQAVYEYMVSRKMRPARIEYFSGYGIENSRLVITQD